MTTDLDPAAFKAYLGKTRWFGGKGRPFEVTDVRAVGAVPGTCDGGPRAVIHLVEVTYADVAPDAADHLELYQVPISFYPEAEQRLDHAFIGWWEDPEHGWTHAYDAVHDREAMSCWLRSFDEAAATGTLTDETTRFAFHRLPGHELDLTAPAKLFAGEQSNSSVAFGSDALLKVFRKVTPGVNPDVVVHDVLTRAGSETIASLYGWLDVAVEGGVIQLAMLQEYLHNAIDGWDLALSSVRNLFAEADLHAHEVGGDFSSEATRLGESLREVHEVLRTHFPSEERPAVAAGELATAMHGRLDAATVVVPQLAEFEARLRAAYDRVAALGELDVQQIHGDLHLGQTLRTTKGWKIVDFEGEPAKPLAERLLPDSPWRDVAGMLRSFDYAPHVVERGHDDVDGADATRRSFRAAEWANRNKNHFLVAYSGGHLSEHQQVLLDAYVADKAVYETVYEARNRPTWVTIPLEAIARIGGS